MMGMMAAKSAITLNQRIAAANNVAQADGGTPFYWFIGDKTGVICSGTYGTPSYALTDKISLASASKLLFHLYVAQARTIGSSDYAWLNMTSGYVGMGGNECAQTDSVNSCLATNGSWTTHYPAWDGIFFYTSSHFENYAQQVLGLGSYYPNLTAGSPTLAALYNTTLALPNNSISFSQPSFAGGAIASTNTYCTIMQKLVNNEYNLYPLLGTQLVPASAALGATKSPAPAHENWYYGLGNWLETDGTHSSGGSFGFYPCVFGSNNEYWMIVSRQDMGLQINQVGLTSVRTGQRIRNSFLMGTSHQPHVIMNTSLPTVTIGSPYSGTVTVSLCDNATGPVGITVDQLPSGLNLGSPVNNGDGTWSSTISGTPTSNNITSSFTVTANPGIIDYDFSYNF